MIRTFPWQLPFGGIPHFQTHRRVFRFRPKYGSIGFDPYPFWPFLAAMTYDELNELHPWSPLAPRRFDTRLRGPLCQLVRCLLGRLRWGQVWFMVWSLWSVWGIDWSTIYGNLLGKWWRMVDEMVDYGLPSILDLISRLPIYIYYIEWASAQVPPTPLYLGGTVGRERERDREGEGEGERGLDR